MQTKDDFKGNINDILDKKYQRGETFLPVKVLQSKSSKKLNFPYCIIFRNIFPKLFFYIGDNVSGVKETPVNKMGKRFWWNKKKPAMKVEDLDTLEEVDEGGDEIVDY